MRLGIDVGSTTVKVVVFETPDDIKFSKYVRHNVDIKQTLFDLLKEVNEKFQGIEFQIAISGSAGMGYKDILEIDFVQEVIGASAAVKQLIPDTDTVIELGGEDAKLTFFKPTLDQRMNGSCAGGTGAFIDQMSSLLDVTPIEMNELAKNYSKIYTIASRCGVFAKTDVQPLINDGAAKEDLAASIFQAVVTQTIAGLAQGKKVEGNVVFLGGPLTFLSELRIAFERTLEGQVDNFLLPKNSEFFIAIGAGMLSSDKIHKLDDIIKKLDKSGNLQIASSSLQTLFENEKDYKDFKDRHSKNSVPTLELKKVKGDLFFGLDAGSTTIKACLIDENNNLVYEKYCNNLGNPVDRAKEILEDIYKKIPKSADIKYSTVTGYGEGLIKAALNLDNGVVETLAHYKGANYLSKGVTSIIDIGGQDMKYIKVDKDGNIESIAVNEACSSGCGSFLETFAKNMKFTIQEFADAAIESKAPVDLGSRCTVFMNSSVKQALKNGATPKDISAGLSYSVVKNALYKVIKLRDVKDLGDNIVVQGGTFNNNSVLRAFELLTGLKVVRPNISGLMGAFGCALVSKENYKKIGKTYQTTTLDTKNLEKFSYKTELINCKFCPNKCLLTVSKFENSKSFLSGNKCEKGFGMIDQNREKNKLPNLYEYKYKTIFTPYTTKPLKDRSNIKIGIPRALNMFENYPIWNAFWMKLGFKVVLSPDSSHKLFEKGIDTISSENLCYPAKLIHGHLEELIRRRVDFVFYPCVTYENKITKDSDNDYNCPVVANYPQVIQNNMSQFLERNKPIDKQGDKIPLINPYLSFQNKEYLPKRLLECLTKEYNFDITFDEVKIALKEAFEFNLNQKEDIVKEGLYALNYAQKHNKTVVVLASRPYHSDPEVNHGIDKLINQLGMVVISEDSASGIYDKFLKEGKIEELKRPLRSVDQWQYHSRLYKSAALVAQIPNLKLVQLTSFGCGLDAITSEQVQEILKAYGDIYTIIKIDEVSNLGAIKIRLRSLQASISNQDENASQCLQKFQQQNKSNTTYGKEKKLFEKEDKQRRTIIAPQMAPIHFNFVAATFRRFGYKFILLDKCSKEDIEVGLKYVNNDACFPAIMVIGQLINKVISEKLDPKDIAVIMSQTGGMCRATNYISLLRLGLEAAGYGDIPVLSISTSSTIENHPGFNVNTNIMIQTLKIFILGDVLQDLVLRIRPYEKQKGDTNKLYQKWNNEVENWILGNSRYKGFKKIVKAMIKDFDNYEMLDIERKPRVGIVGEILVKFHPDANNNAAGVIEDEGCEAVIPGITAFMTKNFYIAKFNKETLGKGSMFGVKVKELTAKFIDRYIDIVNKEYEKTNWKFDKISKVSEIIEMAKEVTSPGVQTGEGWLLAGECVELIHRDSPNIICANPFACLPNHVTGRGIFKQLRTIYPDVNITSIDYDPGSSEVNQLNRIKLMISSINDKDKIRSNV